MEVKPARQASDLEEGVVEAVSIYRVCVAP